MGEVDSSVSNSIEEGLKVIFVWILSERKVINRSCEGFQGHGLRCDRLLLGSWLTESIDLIYSLPKPQCHTLSFGDKCWLCSSHICLV